MKSLIKQNITIWILLFIVTFIGIDTMIMFMSNHAYYGTMITTTNNRITVIRSILCAAIPISLIVRSKEITGTPKINILNIIIALLIWLLLFSWVYFGLRDSFLSSGWLIFSINTIILFAIWRYYIVGITALWSMITRHIPQLNILSTPNISHMFLSMGLGLGSMLLIIQILVTAGLLYSGIVRWLFIALGYSIYEERKQLLAYQDIISNTLSSCSYWFLQKSQRGIGIIVLLLLSISYYYFGFQMSFIPYSTARDANHAYMYFPKVVSEYWWFVAGTIDNMPLRSSFITFRFSLIQPIKSRFWLSPDTIWVSMNFISSIFVILFGLGLVYEVLSYLQLHINKTSEKISWDLYQFLFQTGRLGIILRLTSWMWAFLVIVDNKTDLWVLALTLLALTSGFIFMHQAEKTQTDIISAETITYAIVSGLLFCLAIMAKPTAFIDVTVFGLIMVGLRVGRMTMIGGGFIIIGLLTKLQILNMRDFFAPDRGRFFIIPGLLLILREPLKLIQKNHLKPLALISIRWASFLWFLLIIKGPLLLTTQLRTETFSPSNFAKGLLMWYVSQPAQQSQPQIEKNADTSTQPASQQPILLASTITYTDLLAQNTPTVALTSAPTQQGRTVITPNKCTLSNQNLTAWKNGTLYTGLKIGFWSNTNEDIGRYVWYWQQTFDGVLNKWSGPRWWFLLWNNACIWPYTSAVMLCQQKQAINTFDVPKLQELLTKMPVWTSWYNLLKNILSSDNVKNTIKKWSGINLLMVQDEIKTLNEYYKDTVIEKTNNIVYIPYRYIVPFNVVFNRSLQNLSSYYTDIGFIWLFMMLFVIVASIYSAHKKNTLLNTMSIATILWWTMRWLIAWGILRYGIGLIIWTILTVMLFFYELETNNKNDEQTLWYHIFLIILWLWIVLQLIFNIVRIASQWSSGPFNRYKQSVGMITRTSPDLTQQQTTKVWYSAQDVFNLQFPHYNKFINHTKTRADTDGVLIAGTYLQYFLHNQRNIVSDWWTTLLREMWSDNNICNTYLRLKDKNIKYLVIDPNIVSIAMWGNNSVIDRFFAKINPVDGSIEQHGTMTLLIKLRKDGYMNLFGSNNLWSKYAFVVSDQSISDAFWATSEEEIIKRRAKLAIARFMPEAQQLIGFVGKTFDQRMADGSAIDDISDVFGRTISLSTLQPIATLAIQQMSNRTDNEWLRERIKNLTQDERFILAIYVNAAMARGQTTNKQSMERYQWFVQNTIIQQSIGWGSQLMIFELK